MKKKPPADLELLQLRIDDSTNSAWHASDGHQMSSPPTLSAWHSLRTLPSRIFAEEPS